jgi:hypothetical protein
MTLPVTIPNTFANATTSIPLANLDANFVTIYDAVNGIGNGAESLANVSITGGSVSNATFANANVTSGNATFTTANVTTLDATNVEVTNIKAKDGTAAVVLTDSTGAVAVSTPLTANGGVVFNESGADVDFRVEGDTNANLLFVDASTDRIGVGLNTPETLFHTVSGSANSNLFEYSQSATLSSVVIPVSVKSKSTTSIGVGCGTGIDFIIQEDTAAYTGARINTVRMSSAHDQSFVFSTRDSGGTLAERARITSAGDFMWNKTGSSLTTVGFEAMVAGTTGPYLGLVNTTASAGFPLIIINRQTADGDLVSFRHANTEEGKISVSGTTVTYGGGHLGRWAQLFDGSKDESLKKGTVLSNLDEMNVYVKPTLYWTEEDELPMDEGGNPTVAIGDVKQETSVSENEQLNKVKVSDVEGDPNVAGVFVNWDYDDVHQVDEINMAMTGDMIIRIAQGVTVARGDLLVSAGDGTAKPQGDDIVRSKTIAKVTSTHVTCTYDDGSYCVPCVLMAC